MVDVPAFAIGVGLMAVANVYSDRISYYWAGYAVGLVLVISVASAARGPQSGNKMPGKRSDD